MTSRTAWISTWTLSSPLGPGHLGVSDPPVDSPSQEAVVQHQVRRRDQGAPATYTPEDKLVGIEKPKKDVLDLLQPQSEEQLKVVSIVGPRGLGKTDLARVVYNSLNHDSKFSCRAWVDASDCIGEHGKSRLHRKILKELNRQAGMSREATAADASDLATSLQTYLRNRRYLIVIDDLQLQDWKNLRYAFPDDNNSYGRILVTTCVERIARGCSSRSGSLYKMQTLGKEHSWELFMKEVFGSEEEECPRHLLGRIVNKCDGLPLALVSIAELVRTRKSELHRPQTAKRTIESVCASLGHYLDKNGDLERVKHALESTYYSLPGYDLKNCLLSVSIFPAGYPIKKDRLVRRWLAEGLIAQDTQADEDFEENKVLGRLIGSLGADGLGLVLWV